MRFMKKQIKIETIEMVSYILDNKIQIHNFLEIGSHHGHDASYIQESLSLSPKNIYIVEAHPKFSKDIKDMYPDYNIYNFGAWNDKGSIEFNAAKNFDDGRSSFLSRDIYQSNFEQISIEAKRIDQFILDENIGPIDSCKIDVEGASFEVLEGFGEQLSNVKVVQIEAEQYNVWPEQKDYTFVYSKLEELNFEKVWELRQGSTQLDSLWVKK